MRRTVGTLAVATASMAYLAAAPLAAQPTTSAVVPESQPVATVAPETVARVARRLNCPLCQGYTLQDCPLVVCAQMRQLIADRMAAGATDEAIMAEFVDTYGPEVLNAPPFGVVWVIPAAVLLMAAAAVAFGVAHQAATGTPAQPGDTVPGATSQHIVDRLERLVAARRRGP